MHAVSLARLTGTLNGTQSSLMTGQNACYEKGLQVNWNCHTWAMQKLLGSTTLDIWQWSDPSTLDMWFLPALYWSWTERRFYGALLFFRFKISPSPLPCLRQGSIRALLVKTDCILSTFQSLPFDFEEHYEKQILYVNTQLSLTKSVSVSSFAPEKCL